MIPSSYPRVGRSGEETVIKTQLTMYVKNRAGELARATGAIASARVNMEGISIAETADLSLVQVVVNNARAARRAIRKAGIPVTEQKVAVLALADRPGALAEMTRRLTRKKININYLYATSPTSRPGAECSVVISADNLRQVQALWKD
jgi:hypothetical protein